MVTHPYTGVGGDVKSPGLPYLLNGNETSFDDVHGELALHRDGACLMED